MLSQKHTKRGRRGGIIPRYTRKAYSRVVRTAPQKQTAAAVPRAHKQNDLVVLRLIYLFYSSACRARIYFRNNGGKHSCVK
jgi:hypothetical protein